MIEILHGERETVIYDESLKIRAYLNVQEDSYPSHWQPSFEIIMPIQGNYEVTVNETQLLLAPGDTLLIPPGILHRIAKPTVDGSRYILLFDPDLFIQVPGMQNLYRAFLPYAFFPSAPENTPSDQNDMRSIISSIYQWNASNHRLRYAYIYSLLLNFLLEASRRFTPVGGSGTLIQEPSRDTADRLQNACRFIENNIAKDLHPAGTLHPGHIHPLRRKPGHSAGKQNHIQAGVSPQVHAKKRKPPPGASHPVDAVSAQMNEDEIDRPLPVEEYAPYHHDTGGGNKKGQDQTRAEKTLHSAAVKKEQCQKNRERKNQKRSARTEKSGISQCPEKSPVSQNLRIISHSDKMPGCHGFMHGIQEEPHIGNPVYSGHSEKARENQTQVNLFAMLHGSSSRSRTCAPSESSWSASRTTG